ncbi:MAG TPA: NAD-dependent epimerase/dehydratase family protein, partial [Acidimicrobiia bacterium]|nr:NAD-dependent epimerase/dehydratase family protein [Acidimicrobiia bacterium]
MKVAITGASGFIGSSLARALGPAGHDVLPVVRRRPGPGEIGWD